MGQLFSKRNKEVFSAPLGIDNPVTVQVLGICSALRTVFQCFLAYEFILEMFGSNFSTQTRSFTSMREVIRVVQLPQ